MLRFGVPFDIPKPQKAQAVEVTTHKTVSQTTETDSCHTGCKAKRVYRLNGGAPVLSCSRSLFLRV